MNDNSRKKINGIIEAVIVFFSYMIIPSLIYIIVNKTFNVNNRILCEDLTYLIYLIPLCLYYKNTFIEDAKKFKKDNYMVIIKCYIIGIIVMAISNIIINFIIFDGTIASNESLNRELLGTNKILGLLLASILAPLVEEITFRRGFKNISDNKWIFVFVTTFIFALLHVSSGLLVMSEEGSLYVDWIQLVYLIPYGSLGFSFALAYKETDNIYSNILMHMFHNTLTLLMVFMIS